MRHLRRHRRRVALCKARSTVVVIRRQRLQARHVQLQWGLHLCWGTNVWVLDVWIRLDVAVPGVLRKPRCRQLVRSQRLLSRRRGRRAAVPDAE